MYHVVPKIDIVKQVTLMQSEILQNKLMYVFGDRG